MGYSFTVGEKVKNDNFDDIIKDAIADGYSEEDCETRLYTAKSETSDDAPAYDEPTDHMNQRWPSYTSWAAFLYTSNLNDLFLEGNDNLIGEHPGYIDITPELYKEIQWKYTRFKMQNKGSIPSFEDEDFEKYDKILYYKDYEIPVNHTLARFDWLMYWLDYSMNKYDEVIMSNT